MTIHHNGRGRSYAVCDAPGCEANVIDLSLNTADADRVVRNFFLWKNVGGGRHRCEKCAAVSEKRAPRRRRNWSNAWKRRSQS